MIELNNIDWKHTCLDASYEKARLVKVHVLLDSIGSNNNNRHKFWYEFGCAHTLIIFLLQYTRYLLRLTTRSTHQNISQHVGCQIFENGKDATQRGENFKTIFDIIISLIHIWFNYILPLYWDKLPHAVLSFNDVLRSCVKFVSLLLCEFSSRIFVCVYVFCLCDRMFNTFTIIRYSLIRSLQTRFMDTSRSGFSNIVEQVRSLDL